MFYILIQVYDVDPVRRDILRSERSSMFQPIVSLLNTMIHEDSTRSYNRIYYNKSAQKYTLLDMATGKRI